MLTATIEVEPYGSGVDQHDNSLVRYTIWARVTGTELPEVVAFENAWKQTHPQFNKIAGNKRRERVVTIKSPGWVYAGIGTEKVAKALRELGVEVDDGKSKDKP